MVFQSPMPHWSDRGTGNVRYMLHIVPGPVETSLNTSSSAGWSGNWGDIAWSRNPPIIMEMLRN